MFRPSALITITILTLLVGACGGPSAGSPAPNGASSSATSDLQAVPTHTPAPSGPRSAVLFELQNTVETREAEAADWQAAFEGQQIAAGGLVQTGDEARAGMDISDGTRVRLAGNTVFVLHELSAEPTDPVTRLSLSAGKVWIVLTQALGRGTFEVETPTGVATVRGSMMSAEYFSANGHFIASCLEGLCRLTGQSGAFTDLVGGQQSGIPGFGKNPTPPKQIDAAQLAGWAGNVPEAQAIVAITTPGPLPTETPTPTPPPGSAGQTACDHPYLPLRPGATWTYAITGGTLVWTVTGVTGDTTSATAEMTSDVSTSEGNVHLTYTWLCDATGIVSYQFGGLNVAQFGQVASYEVVSHVGTFLPPADLLVPGYAWSNEFQLAMQMAEQVGGVSMSGTSTTSERYIVAGATPVTFGGQTFDGLQIERSGGSDIQVQIPGIEVPPTHLDTSGTLVLARGIGMVLVDGSTTLTAYSVP